MKPQTFIFIGRSGCGKGTQAKLLIEELKKRDKSDVFYLSTGQVFRDLIKEKSYTANLSRENYEVGGIQPEFMAIWAWSNMLVQNLKESDHLIVDGMPRKLLEAKVFETAVSFYKRREPLIIYIDVSVDWAKEKLFGRGRTDDDEKEINAKMLWFEEEVLPVVDFFKGNSRFNFVHINGEQSVEKVSEEILSKVFK